MSIQILAAKSQGKKVYDSSISKCIVEKQGTECLRLDYVS